MLIQKFNPLTGKVETYAVEKGERGEPGASIPGKDGIDGRRGSLWFYGNGKPGVILGAISRDKYLDVDTGDVYELE
jgi:hypothetical protein